MNKTATLIFTILFMIACSSIALSAETKGQYSMFAGQIVSIDTEHKTLTLKEDTKGTFTCAYGDNTKFFSNNQQKTISDLKVGDIAAVVYAKSSGKDLAKSVSFFKPAP